MNAIASKAQPQRRSFCNGFYCSKKKLVSQGKSKSTVFFPQIKYCNEERGERGFLAFARMQRVTCGVKGTLLISLGKNRGKETDMHSK